MGRHQPETCWFTENRDIGGPSVGDEVCGAVSVSSEPWSLVVVDLRLFYLPHDTGDHYVPSGSEAGVLQGTDGGEVRR